MDKRQEAIEKRNRLFMQLAAVEERVVAGSSAGGSTREATQALQQAALLLDSDFVLSDVKSANRELDFCESALASCSDAVGGAVTVKDIFNTFDHNYRQLMETDGGSLKKWCLSIAAHFRSCPPWDSLKIAVESVAAKDPTHLEQTLASQKEKAAKRKSMAEANKELAAAERLANNQADEANDAERVAADEHDLETVNEMNAIRKSALDQLHANGNAPIDYWRFVFDSSSKGTTFMRILRVNHVLQKKDVLLVEGSTPGTLYLAHPQWMTENAQTALDLQTISFVLTDDLYNSLKQRYDR